MGLVTKKTICALRDRFTRCEEMSHERERRRMFKCRLLDTNLKTNMAARFKNRSLTGKFDKIQNRNRGNIVKLQEGLQLGKIKIFQARLRKTYTKTNSLNQRRTS
jgi:hypothetical protein